MPAGALRHLRAQVNRRSLLQPFNSLDAQRESAEAYISSQRHMGWKALERRYEDGGYTGANLERPALRTLMEDIRSGQVDCVVVYKVDRLSRSLLDFSRLIGMFEEHGVSLVSVTQQLNTTDSLGRLTLNILLSFAQFERELIAERTRDKMRAARRKGKWLGGQPILGYEVDPEQRGLKINAEEAQRVRWIFQQIAEGKSVQAVLDELSGRGWTTKHWISRSGREHPGRALAESDLVRLVQNVMYLGKLRDVDQIYQGQHAAIIDAELWERANAAINRWHTSARVKGRNRLQTSTAARGAQVAGMPSVPRIRRLLALALKMEQMMHEGTVKNYSELAHLGGSGANSSRRSDRLSFATLSDREWGSSCECRVPQFRHRRMASAEFARLELPLLDLLCPLDSRDRYHCVIESLESQHRPDSLLHSPMVLLHQIVQVLAGSNPDATRKFAVVLHLPHRTMRGRIGVQRDFRGHASVLHRAAKKRFGGVHVSVPTEKEIHRLARFVDGAIQVHPLSANLYVGLVHPPRSSNRSCGAPPAFFELWKVMLNPPQDRGMGHGDPTVRHHDHQIPQAQFETRVPTHTQNDNLPVEMSSFE